MAALSNHDAMRHHPVTLALQSIGFTAISSWISPLLSALVRRYLSFLLASMRLSLLSQELSALISPDEAEIRRERVLFL